MKSALHIEHTRHKEYSLVLTVAAGTVLLFAAGAQSFAALCALSALAVASILWSAFSVVRHADVLAHRFGEPFGSLILSLAIVILEVGMISILMLSGNAAQTLMRDTIYSVIMIVMAGLVGMALLFGGYKYKSQNFNFTGIKHYLISIIPLATVVLAMPTVMDAESYTPAQLVVVSAACVGLYLFFLRIQTVTHRDFFVYEDEDEDGGHGKASSHSTAWHFTMLAVHLVAVIGITKLNSGSLNALMALLNAPPAFAGFLVALLILSPEGTGAFSAILRDQPQRAMNLFLGSVLATISLTVPVVVCVALLTGQQVQLGLSMPEILLMAATFMVCQSSLTTGETNAHSGAAHVALFVIYIMMIFA